MVEIEPLRAKLTLIRQEAIELDRRGFSREAFELKWEAVLLSGKIEQLEVSRHPA
jgi:hypothetical protein